MFVFVLQMVKMSQTPLRPRSYGLQHVSNTYTRIAETEQYLSSGATALQGLGRQSGRRRSAKLVPTFADRGVSRGQRNGSPRPLIPH